jgi:RNA polymerase sigma factor (TIGR02999 family)
MRRILVENARRKKRLRHGGGRHRIELVDDLLPVEAPVGDLLAFDDALERLTAVDGQAAEMVKLRIFSGLTTEEAARVMGLSPRGAYRTWAFARAWLFRRLGRDDLTSAT